MTAPVKERGTRKNLPLHFRSAFSIPLRFRSTCPTVRNSPWGKILL